MSYKNCVTVTVNKLERRIYGMDMDQNEVEAVFDD